MKQFEQPAHETPACSENRPHTEPESSPAQTTKSPLLNGSDWGRQALAGIKEMYENEEARQAVARRLF